MLCGFFCGNYCLEVYEQGRVGRLRDDLGRQLEMLDEFADLGTQKLLRNTIITTLSESAAILKPLYEERESLMSSIACLGQLEEELAEKESLLPNLKEDQRWADASAVVQSIEGVVEELCKAAGECPDPTVPRIRTATLLDDLFGQKLPVLDADSVAESETLIRWNAALRTALDKVERARQAILHARDELIGASVPLREEWRKATIEHEHRISEQLARAGIESPKELMSRVEWLRREVNKIKGTYNPRLTEVRSIIDKKEEERVGLLDRLERLTRDITETRKRKAEELTARLDGELRISINPAADTSEYRRVVSEICAQLSSQSHRIQNREAQMAIVIKSITPWELAKALKEKGQITGADGKTESLHTKCGITENTQSVLCTLNGNIEQLNKLETLIVEDVPVILVRRRRESSYAHLHTGLSPGEQSAAILTLALETRTRPLILDQPEDELGYGYVVNLIVPKLLQVKFNRQLIVVTHDANVPVLGDADYVIKMENQPRGEQGRACVSAAAGCFESPSVTSALLELEGGQQAFQFRKHRYALPKMC